MAKTIEQLTIRLAKVDDKIKFYELPIEVLVNKYVLEII